VAQFGEAVANLMSIRRVREVRNGSLATFAVLQCLVDLPEAEIGESQVRVRRPVEALHSLVANGIDVFEALKVPSKLRLRLALSVPQVVRQERRQEVVAIVDHDMERVSKELDGGLGITVIAKAARFHHEFRR
jgi:hypothetical protein